MNIHLSHGFKFAEKIWFIYSQRIHKALVHKKANFYLKPNDIISHRPTLFGYHELLIEKLINRASAEYSDFFLDLGANIGLTTALVGNRFKRIDCVEPNELVFNILKTNLAINLNSNNYQCHMIGLVRKDGILNLLILKNNFGGAFINEDNRRVIKKAEDYSERLIEVQVVMRSAKDWFKKYFSDLEREQQKRGIIKIDVEVYEEIIFESLIATLPKKFEVLVIMENWFEDFPINKCCSPHHSLSWSYIRKTKRMLHSIPFKLLGLSSSYKHELVELTEHSKNPHDITCQIRAKRSG